MANSFLLQDIRVFTGERVIENGYVLVKSGKISSVGDMQSLPPNTNTDSMHVFSKPGHTVVPGLIDAHIHADKGNPLAIIQSLRFGVTTVMDMHNEPPNVKKLKAMSRENMDVADFKSACLAATIENGWPVPVVTAHDKSPETLAEISTWPKLSTASDVDSYLDQNIADGADYIKLMHESGAAMGQNFTKPDTALQRAVIEGAHRRGYKTVCHALAREDTIQILEAGVDGMTHTFFDQAPDERVLQAYKKNNAWLNPTLAAIGTLAGDGLEMQKKYANDKRIQHLIEPQEKEKVCKCWNFKAETSKLEYAYESVRMLHAAGIDIVCGSDAAGPLLGVSWGLSIHHEMALLVHAAGMTPEQALKAATSVTAKRFGWHDRGGIAEGLKGDLLLVEGNPLQDIDNTLNIRGVWREGVLSSTYRQQFV